MNRKVYFIDTVHEVLAERLSHAGFECVDLTEVPVDQLINKMEDAYGIVIRAKIKLTAEILSHMPSLHFIARSGSGLENVAVAYCQDKNIKLFNSPEGNRNAVGEHALGMLLSLLNNIPKANNEIRKGIWDREGNRGEELDGKIVGIIGYGNNGSAFAKKLRGFDVKVMAYDCYKQGFGDHFVQECTLEALQDQADVISFHIPQNKDTIYFLNKEFIDKCGKPFYVINLSRGKIIQTSALVDGLKSGKVKGACLDVLEFEKSSFESFFEQTLTEEFSYLLGAKNVLMTPHVGGWTKESYFKLSNVLADKILEYYS